MIAVQTFDAASALSVRVRPMASGLFAPTAHGCDLAGGPAIGGPASTTDPRMHVVTARLSDTPG